MQVGVFKNALRVFAAVAACALILVVPAFAQTSAVGAITGTVLDPDGKAVVNAAVVVRGPAGVTRAVSTDASGRFSIAELPVGAYVIEVTASGFALAHRDGLRVATGKPDDMTIALTIGGVTEEVTVSAELPAAAQVAPSQGSLTARSAQSQISGEFIQNYTSPISDYSQVVLMAPGTFSVSPNGVGLGDTKTFFRGFKDGQYNMSFDGIPFNDTNDPTHHSWAFFPGQFIGSTIFDRSPGSASSIGPSTYGGSVNMLSRTLERDPIIRGSASYGSFNTRLFDADLNTGAFGPGGRSRLQVDVHQMKSDGFQTFNFQQRNAFEAKYQFVASERTTLSAFAGVIRLTANTPNQKGSTRAQVAQFGDNFLMTNDPASPLYYKYNFYDVPTDFEYVGVKTDLGHGWSLDDKVYTLRYFNKQNYNGVTSITTTSATDKLNSYRKVGNLLPIMQVSQWGVLKTGLWSELAFTDRYQVPSDPRTWIDAALPNFHEMFTTTTLQPYAEYEFRVTPQLRITPGVKLAYYKQDFRQYADNGKTVGSLNGAAFVQHAASYDTWLPSLDAHYLLQRNWSVYGQYGKGQAIPPSSVFDVKNGAVAVLPNPILTDTYQVGSVFKANRFTLDIDTYRIKYESDYSSTPDATGEPVYFLNGSSVTKGVEVESNVLVGGGFSVYLNATSGAAKYDNTGLWAQNAPKDTETIGLNLNRANWNIGFFNKRVGVMYNDNGSVHQAVTIDPFNIANLFVNFTVKGSSALAPTKIRFAVNNLLDSHAITAVTPALTTTSVPAPGDILTLMGARSVSLTFTVGFSPK